MGAGKSRRNDNRNQMMKPMVGSMPPNYMQAPPHGMAYAQPPQPQPTFMTAPQVQPLPPLPPPPQMGMYPIQQVGPMPPMYCHQPVMMHTPHQFTVMGDQKRSSLFPGPPQHSSGFHMGPSNFKKNFQKKLFEFDFLKIKCVHLCLAMLQIQANTAILVLL